MPLSPLLLGAVHAALRTLAQQLADRDGGDLDSLVDPIVFLALPTAVRALRVSRLAAEMRKREEPSRRRAKRRSGGGDRRR